MATVSGSKPKCGVTEEGNSVDNAVWGEANAMRYARGAFKARHFTKFRDFLDGLSNSMLCGEVVVDSQETEISGAAIRAEGAMEGTSPAAWATQAGVDGIRVDPLRPRNYTGRDTQLIVGNSDRGRGRQWANGREMHSRFHSIRPPNSYNVMRWWDNNGMWGASSRHQGGCHVAMGDGAIKFITDSVDTGDQNFLPLLDQGRGLGQESPYGVWGAAGTIASKETSSLDD